MIGGVTHHMLPHLPAVPHPHVNKPVEGAYIWGTEWGGGGGWSKDKIR